jgi:hypothetical protein
MTRHIPGRPSKVSVNGQPSHVRVDLQSYIKSQAWKDVGDAVYIREAVEAVVADPTSDSLMSRAVEEMRRNPPVTTSVMRALPEASQKTFAAALDGYWSRRARRVSIDEAFSHLKVQS